MNYNYLPVEVKVIEAFSLDGQDYQPGDEVELLWIHSKQLEKAGKVERVLPLMEAEGEPIRDVMVFVPVYRLEPRTMQAVMKLKWNGAITRVFQTDNPHNGSADKRAPDGVLNHLHQYTRGRESFLAGRYDAMLIIEHDIVPPKDALMKLAALNVDMAYGVYVFRVRNSNTINIFERYPDNNGERARNPGESLSCKPWLLWRAIREKKWPCSGGGFGCILIRRRVLEKISFRLDGGTGYCDSPFTEDAYRAGYLMAAEMTVLCDHIDKDGTVFKPKIPTLITAEPERFPLGENGAVWIS